MSADKKRLEEETKEYSFIQEQVLPKRDKKFRIWLMAAGKTIVLAVLFGITASITVCAFFPVFQKLLIKEEVKEEPISFESQKNDSEGQSTKEKSKDTIIIESSVEADVSDYMKMYSELNEVAKQANHSVVTVTGVVNGVDWFNNNYESTHITSGIVVAKDAEQVYILTSTAKIKDADSIKVTFPAGDAAEAKLHSLDSELNLAVLAVNSRGLSNQVKKSFHTAVLGESYLVQSGEPVIALGNPNGYMYSVLFGFITNKSNTVYTIDNRLDLINTDLPDNPNGEGVIVNLQGEIIGIITQKFKNNYNESINTVIGISKLKPIIEKMVNEDERAYLGITGADMTTDIAADYGLKFGVYITEVKSKSPAFEGGLKAGDIIYEINDTDILSVASLNAVLSKLNPGDEIVLKVKRTAGTGEKDESKVTEKKAILGKKR